MEKKSKKEDGICVKILNKLFFVTRIGISNESNRNIWLEKTLKSIPSGFRILDAGAGELKYKKYCQHLNYVSQDFGQYDGQGNQTGLQTRTWVNSKLDIVSDIMSVPEKDSSFDTIMCVEVFEHLPEPSLAIKEFARLLKSGGKLIITAPFASLTHFAPYHFSSGYNKYFYEYHLKRNGFEIISIERNGNYFDYLAQEIRRVPFVKGKYSKKSSNLLLFIYYIPALTVLKIFDVFSNKDEGSEDILCYGYHILAKKN